MNILCSNKYIKLDHIRIFLYELFVYRDISVLLRFIIFTDIYYPRQEVSQICANVSLLLCSKVAQTYQHVMSLLDVSQHQLSL